MKKRAALITGLAVFIMTIVISLVFAQKSDEAENTLTPKGIGEFCVSQVYPSIEWESEKTEDDYIGNEVIVNKKIKKAEKEVDNTKPRIIIYHTHSSESYQPYTESNFHREDEAGTVREVGDVMADELNKLGIAVVHNKTVHDRPSYNQSYERSLETVTALLRQYPTAEIVIDLHRDAAAYTGNVGETITIDGQTVAKFKLVVGRNNDNYAQLMTFARKVNSHADALYPGFAGRIIEKEYRYNEYIADNYLLLEVGNNQNDIEHAKATGKYFAHVLAALLEAD